MSVQRAIRFPEDLHSAISAEAERRGKPWTFSSVLVEWAERGQLWASMGGLGAAHDGDHALPFDSPAMRRANAFAGVEVFTAGAIERASTVPPRVCDVHEAEGRDAQR